MAPEVKGVIIRPEGATMAFLLIHGFCAAPDEVATLGEFLASQGIASFAVQLAGHGTTPEDIKETSWRDWYHSAKEGLEEVRKWNPEYLFVAGLSMGGALSLLLASEERDIAGLVLLAPAVRINGILPKLVPLLKYFWKYRAIDTVTSQEVYDVKRTKYDREPLSAYHELFRLQGTVRENMINVSVPTLIIQGTADKTIDPNNSHLVYDGISSTIKELHLIPGAEHVITCHPTREAAYPLIKHFIDEVTLQTPT